MEEPENLPGAGGNPPGAAGGQPGAGQPTNSLPTDIATLQGMVLNLRRESASYRTRATEAETQLQTADARITELEAKWASADTNTQELLVAKNAEIATLKETLKTANTQLSSFKAVEESQRSELLTQLPETVRENYKELPINVLQSLVKDIAPLTGGPGGSPEVKVPAERGATRDLDAELEQAVAANDQKLIVEIMNEMSK